MDQHARRTRSRQRPINGGWVSVKGFLHRSKKIADMMTMWLGTMKMPHISDEALVVFGSDCLSHGTALSLCDYACLGESDRHH